MWMTPSLTNYDEAMHLTDIHMYTNNVRSPVHIFE